MVPRLAGYAFLSASIAAYEQWLFCDEDEVDLSDLLDEAIQRVGSGLVEIPRRTRAVADLGP
jgi:hypothetical protein